MASPWEGGATSSTAAFSERRHSTQSKPLDDPTSALSSTLSEPLAPREVGVASGSDYSHQVAGQSQANVVPLQAAAAGAVSDGVASPDATSMSRSGNTSFDNMMTVEETESEQATPNERMFVHYDESTTLWQLFKRWDTALMVAFIAAMSAKHTFLISNVQEELEAMFDDGNGQAQQIFQYFNTWYPLLAVLSTPVPIYQFNKFEGREHWYVLLCSLPTVIFCILQCFPSAPAQWAAITIFGPSRSLAWAMYFHFFQNATRYPPMKIGRIYGYGNIVIAILGDVTNMSHLFAVFVHAPILGSLVNRHVAMSSIFAVVIVFTAVALNAFLFWQHRRFQSLRANLING